MQIFPVNWPALTKGGSPATNYQLLPGDRLYIQSNPYITDYNRLNQFLAPIERVFGFTLLGAATVSSVEAAGHGGTGGEIRNRSRSSSRQGQSLPASHHNRISQKSAASILAFCRRGRRIPWQYRASNQRITQCYLRRSVRGLLREGNRDRYAHSPSCPSRTEEHARARGCEWGCRRIASSLLAGRTRPQLL
jgi:hypothetical protein